jgi:hypothetical protein
MRYSLYPGILLFQCAESASKSVIGGLSNTYFVGNAPNGSYDGGTNRFKCFIIQGAYSCFT